MAASNSDSNLGTGVPSLHTVVKRVRYVEAATASDIEAACGPCIQMPSAASCLCAPCHLGGSAVDKANYASSFSVQNINGSIYSFNCYSTWTLQPNGALAHDVSFATANPHNMLGVSIQNI
eukprot:CAMPEP_0197686374 /NCGR_PEP_ID=MMETSP1338-20131121/102402_1 /TAXON_ID=43686 ORGANISM="Pelagodinium beii, Strain RCC1491" /NCGR_SAMPLE_ID=MMETSP1338 /ASSEMBLY_ACC=CAM_ASM_000754 /LENGTH=120 /DNA_ID=CAMNT_0043268299 /DNA_START=206 /DNA_END=568 /DNA_ORIENTATION=+